MYTEMQNDADKGLPFPTTVHQAYTIAANRKEYKLSSGTSGNANAIFAFADAGESPLVGGRGGRGGRGRGRGGRNQPGRGRGSDKGTATKAVVVASVDEYRTCYICLKKNHVRANCPDNPANQSKPAVHVVVRNLDDFESGDEDGFQQRVLVVTDIEFESVLMFKATEVLLDNQGGRSVFQSEDLLRDIIDLTVCQVSMERARKDCLSTAVVCFAISASWDEASAALQLQARMYCLWGTVYTRDIK